MAGRFDAIRNHLLDIAKRARAAGVSLTGDGDTHMVALAPVDEAGEVFLSEMAAADLIDMEECDCEEDDYEPEDGDNMETPA